MPENILREGRDVPYVQGLIIMFSQFMTAAVRLWPSQKVTWACYSGLERQRGCPILAQRQPVGQWRLAG